jgi:hypothetical protein
LRNRGYVHDHMDIEYRMNQDEYRTYSGENVRNVFSRQSRAATEDAYMEVSGRKRQEQVFDTKTEDDYTDVVGRLRQERVI